MPAHNPCDGCTGCAGRCTDGIAIAYGEFAAILRLLRRLPHARVRAVLAQPKERAWGEEASYRACLFLDLDSELCLVYPARPLVCRLFGLVRHLPCPRGTIPATLDARHLLRAYTRQPLRTFAAWLARAGLTLPDLLAGTISPRRRPARPRHRSPRRRRVPRAQY